MAGITVGWGDNLPGCRHSNGMVYRPMNSSPMYSPSSTTNLTWASSSLGRGWGSYNVRILVKIRLGWGQHRVGGGWTYLVAGTQMEWYIDQWIHLLYTHHLALQISLGQALASWQWIHNSHQIWGCSLWKMKSKEQKMKFDEYSYAIYIHESKIFSLCGHETTENTTQC